MNDGEPIRFENTPEGVHGFALKQLDGLLSQADTLSEEEKASTGEIFWITQGAVMAKLVKEGILASDGEYSERHGNDIFREMWRKGMPNTQPATTYGEHAFFLMKRGNIDEGVTFLVEEMKKRLAPLQHTR